MQAFGIDRQAAKPRRIIGVGERAPSGRAKPTFRATLKFFAPYRGAKRNGKALQLPSIGEVYVENHMKRAVLLLCAGLTAFAGSLVTNGGFADGKSDWRLPDNAVIDATTAAPAEDGNGNSLKVVSERRWTAVTKRLRVASETDYDLSIWIKTQNAAATHVKIFWRGSENVLIEDSYPITSLPGTQDWKHFSRKIHTAKGAHTAILCLMGGADDGKAGTAWFDEISFAPVDQAKHDDALALFRTADYIHPMNAMKPSGESVVLKNISRYGILISESADAQDKYAAKVLSDALKSAFGAEFAIVNDGQAISSPFISIGETRQAKAANVALHPELQGYRIAVKDNNIFLQGSRSGSYYAVLAFLQEDLGYRFYTPDDKVKVPWFQRNSICVTPREYAPVFEIREPLCGQFVEAMDFNAFNRVQAVSYWKSVPDFMGGGFSNTEYFIHTYDKLIPAAKYFKEHPEYFPMRNGKREPSTQTRGQLCYTNQGVADTIASLLEEAMAKQPASRIYSVSQNDNTTVECECPECKAVKDGVPGASLLLANRVSEKLAKSVPDIRITTLAYVETQKVTEHIQPSPNTVIFYAPIRQRAGCLMNLPWQDVPQIATELKGWSAAAKRIYVWDYNNSQDMMPFLDLQEKNIDYWVENGVTGVFIEDNECGLNSLGPLKNWVLMQKLWNPKWKVDALVEDYISGHYGKAADEMREYVALQRNRWKNFYSTRKQGEGLVFTKDDYARMNSLLEAAYAKTPTDEIAAEIVACNRMQLKACRKSNVDAYEARLNRTLALLKKHGLSFHTRRRQNHDDIINAWKDSLKDVKEGVNFPVYCEDSVIYKDKKVVPPCKSVEGAGSYMPTAARHTRKLDWHVQWKVDKLLQSVDNQSVVVARMRVKPDLKKKYPADKKLFSLHLWRAGLPIDEKNGRYVKAGELQGDDWQFVYLFKVYMYSPSVTGYFYNCIGDIAEDEAILYDYIEFIPLSDFKEKEIADKLPTIEL